MEKLNEKNSVQSIHEAPGADHCGVEVARRKGAEMSTKKQVIVAHAEDLPVLIWANDGETPHEYLDICPVYKEPYHDKMKEVRITVEVIK